MSNLDKWWLAIEVAVDELMSKDIHSINLITGVSPRERNIKGVQVVTPSLDVFKEELHIREQYLQSLRSEKL